MTTDPSPTADATRLIEPWRTSPAANTPGTLVSRIRGLRASGQHPRNPVSTVTGSARRGSLRGRRSCLARLDPCTLQRLRTRPQADEPSEHEWRVRGRLVELHVAGLVPFAGGNQAHQTEWRGRETDQLLDERVRVGLRIVGQLVTDPRHRVARDHDQPRRLPYPLLLLEFLHLGALVAEQDLVGRGLD